MESPLLTAHSTVAEVLSQWPQVIQVFLGHQMTCVGCTMAPFDTLADVAAIYGLDIASFLNELRQSVQPKGEIGMKITEALLGEHGVFYAQFDHLEQVIPTATTLVQAQNQAALLAAGLKPHANMEEELLFRSLEPHLGVEFGPLPVMRMEHQEIEGALSRVQEVQELAAAQDLVLHAVQVARDHFAKEEQILFPIAEQMMGVAALTRLGHQWALRRGVRLSIGGAGQ